MILSIYDFPLKIENDFLKNCKNEVLLNLSNVSKDTLIQFIKENVFAINDGKRVYKKRLTKTLNTFNLKEALDIIKTEMFEKGYILSDKSLNEIEYTIIYNFNKKEKFYFRKININMEENKENIKKHLSQILCKIIDAKEKNNITEENKEIALKDLIKFLNLFYNNIISKKNLNLERVFNYYQEIWFYAIKDTNKKVKYSLLKITTGLWRDYIITIFKAKGETELLTKLTGWNSDMLKKEQLNYDMKLLLLSVNETLKNIK